jgi:iron(III) transport system permease protein
MKAGAPSRGTLLLAGPLLLLLIWVVLYPNLFVMGDSLVEGGELTLRWYRDFVGSRARMEALRGSVWISLASVVTSALVGIPLAFLLTRRDFPGRVVLSGLAAVPVLLPPLVGVIAFLFLFGESGIFTRTLQLVLGMDEPPWRLVGPWAILVVHTYSMYVYFYLLVSAGLARLDDSAAEAAASLGAGQARIFFRVTLPMLAPSVMAASVLVFMTSMASFSAPYIFGGATRSSPPGSSPAR